MEKWPAILISILICLSFAIIFASCETGEEGDDEDKTDNKVLTDDDDDDDIDDDVPEDDPLCDEGFYCEDVEGSNSFGCVDIEGNAPEDAKNNCHLSGECDGNASCHFTNDDETESVCIENCGLCSTGLFCIDLTEEGYLGCLQDGGIPDGAVQQCHQKGGCPDNATCFFTNSSKTRSVCIENCSICKKGECGDGFNCADSGVCVPNPCTPGSCDNGLVCWDGRCVPDTGEGPGAGPGSDCMSLPDLICEGTEDYCGELIQFEPAEGDGYTDYPENGESWANQYRSWLRRDVVMMIKYAAAYVSCKADSWAFGNGGPVGLIDMSEQDGAIPGTSIGSPGHPSGTHTDGKDIDVSYFQVNTSDNAARPICEHYEWYGSEAYHCSEYPDLLDPWRQALFIGAIFEHPALRVIGCDGKAGPMIEYALNDLCQNDWLSDDACNNNKLTFEEKDQGYGWYHFHHHHIHVSFTPPNYDAKGGTRFVEDSSRCLIPGCDSESLRLYLEKVR